MFDECHAWPAGGGQFAEIVETSGPRVADKLIAGQAQRLHHEQPPGSRRCDIQPQQRIAQVIKNPEKQHQVEALRHMGQIINVELPQADPLLHPEALARPAGLTQVVGIVIHRQHPGAATRKLDTVKTGIAAYIQCGPSAQVIWKVRRDRRPLVGREITERVIRRGLRTIRKMQIVKPWPQAANLGSEPVFRGIAAGLQSP